MENETLEDEFKFQNPQMPEASAMATVEPVKSMSMSVEDFDWHNIGE